MAQRGRERYRLRVALAGYDAQYGKRSIGEQYPDLPSGAVERIEALVEAARGVEQAGLVEQAAITFYVCDECSVGDFNVVPVPHPERHRRENPGHKPYPKRFVPADQADRDKRELRTAIRNALNELGVGYPIDSPEMEREVRRNHGDALCDLAMALADRESTDG